jgi:Mn-dependent DtxR family transcriptional regulator
VEDFGEKRLVLKACTTEEELLTLLFHYFPSPISASQIHKDMDRRARSTVSNTITSNYRKRLIEGNKQQGYKLTALGYRQASEIVKAWVEVQTE